MSPSGSWHPRRRGKQDPCIEALKVTSLGSREALGALIAEGLRCLGHESVWSNKEPGEKKWLVSNSAVSFGTKREDKTPKYSMNQSTECALSVNAGQPLRGNISTYPERSARCWGSRTIAHVLNRGHPFVFLTGEDEDEFENFMLPLTVSFETILQIFNNNFKQEDVKVGSFPSMGKEFCPP